MEEKEKNKKKDTETGTPQVSPSYPLFQIARAFTTSAGHEDPATRERAEKKIAKWVSVLNGMATGKLDIGSRQAVRDVPPWATLEVVTGGFATGELLASGPLLPHEEALLKRLPEAAQAGPRQILNAHFLSDPGLAELEERLASGCYDVSVPEESALLVVAWLVRNERVDEARALLDELAPYFNRLRFYPVPQDSPRRFGSRVFLQDVGSTIADLKKVAPDTRILAQKEAIGVWIPLYDRVVEMFLETVEGETPRLRTGPDGKPLPRENGKFPVEGGWPCQQFPADWMRRAKEALAEYRELRKDNLLCGKPERRKERFAQLRAYLERCVDNPASLTGRDVGRIRLILACHVSRRGAPGSPGHRELRARQAQQALGPTHHELSRVLIHRLEGSPHDAGLDDLTPVVQPITAEEGRQYKLDPGPALPASLLKKVQRCLTETVEVLVERGIITSGEVLARVLPQITSGLRAAGVNDSQLREVYAATYRAFRRRRSLLLFNLESQVQIEELPWVAAIDRFRSDTLSSQELSAQTLQEILVLCLGSFPQAILPNKLLQELRALATGARLDLPLVDEVAADIFMGEFSDKFLRAARAAASLLEGSFYATYYGIDYKEVRKIPRVAERRKLWFRREASDPFCDYCSARAGVKYGTWDPAVNGMIIEQQQVLTTQNLAIVFTALNLVDAFGDRMENLARECFIWVCARLQVRTDRWHARLIALKNSAYAWRQMVFYLALLSPGQIRSFLSWARRHVELQGSEFQERFAPAMRGLEQAAVGESPTRKFYGWSKNRHWLLGRDDRVDD